MIWPAIVLVLLLVVPGAILGVASGLRSGWALALGPALTFAYYTDMLRELPRATGLKRGLS